jgi:site-specific DNA-cytosine methylase
MRVLVACEYSATVREAFAARGHDAWRCDLIESEKPGKHIKGDVLAVLNDGWDMMIAHPPCQYLSWAGAGHWNKPGRAEKRADAAAFFMRLVEAPIPRICIENPRGIMSQWYRKPDQEVDPWQFGDAARKRTCLWLKGLPLLSWFPQGSFWETAVSIPAPLSIDSERANQPGKRRHFTEFVRNPRERARFFPSVARAMAEQWGDDGAVYPRTA